MFTEKISSHKRGSISHEVFNTMSFDQLIYTICKIKPLQYLLLLSSIGFNKT